MVIYIILIYGQGGIEYTNPSGNVVAENTQIWEGVAIPIMLADYTERKRNELNQTIQYSLVMGFDFYHYTKDFWVHSWGNLIPYHYNDGGEFSYHKFNKSLGVFLEGKYNKYWNRNWHDFSVGVNYVIF